MDLKRLLDEKKAQMEKEKEIKEQFKEAKDEYKESIQLIHALQEYKYFIEVIYPKFIADLIVNYDADRRNPELNIGTIYLDTNDDPADSKFYEISGTGLFLYSQNEDFKHMIYEFAGRYEYFIKGGLRSGIRLNKALEEIVDIYYMELQSLPYIDDQIKQLSEEYGMEVKSIFNK